MAQAVDIGIFASNHIVHLNVAILHLHIGIAPDLDISCHQTASIDIYASIAARIHILQVKVAMSHIDGRIAPCLYTAHIGIAIAHSDSCIASGSDVSYVKAATAHIDGCIASGLYIAYIGIAVMHSDTYTGSGFDIVYGDITFACTDANAACLGTNLIAYGDLSLIGRKAHIASCRSHSGTYVDIAFSCRHGDIISSFNIMAYIDITFTGFYSYPPLHIHIGVKINTALFLQLRH